MLMWQQETITMGRNRKKYEGDAGQEKSGNNPQDRLNTTEDGLGLGAPG